VDQNGVDPLSVRDVLNEHHLAAGRNAADLEAAFGIAQRGEVRAGDAHDHARDSTQGGLVL
jgi:hypothetical protein